MSILRLQNKVPQVYVEESRDFQLLCRLYDAVFNSVIYDTDTMVNITDTRLCQSNFLALLQTKLGFFTIDEFDNESLRTILQAFPVIVKSKGTEKAIIQAVQAFLKIKKITRHVGVTYYEKSTTLKNGYVVPDHTIVVAINSALQDTRILEEIFRYILPSGVGYYFYFYNKITQLEKVTMDDSAKILYVSHNINAQVRGSTSNLIGNIKSVHLVNLLNTSLMTLERDVTFYKGAFTFPSNGFSMIYQPLSIPITGHKYYGRVEQKVPAGTTFDDGRFEYYIDDIPETGLMVFTSFDQAIKDNQWHTYSNILEIRQPIQSEEWTLRSFAVSPTDTVYRRNHMIIDLTESFGIGNEPTKEWCDENIPFFEGDFYIDEASKLFGAVDTINIDGKANNGEVTLGDIIPTKNGTYSSMDESLYLGTYYGDKEFNEFIKDYEYVTYPRYHKYTLSHVWETYPVRTLSDASVIRLESFKYVTGVPYFDIVSEAVPQFSYTNSSTSQSLENGWGVRSWAANSDSIYSIESTQKDFFNYFITITEAHHDGLFDWFWYYSGTIYGLRIAKNIQGTYVETVKAPEGSYPDNGEKDGFWWVKQSSNYPYVIVYNNIEYVYNGSDWKCINFLGNVYDTEYVIKPNDFELVYSESELRYKIYIGEQWVDCEYPLYFLTDFNEVKRDDPDE